MTEASAVPTASLDSDGRSHGAALSASRIVAIGMLAVVGLLVVVVPFLPDFDPYTQRISDSFAPLLSAGHLLGTDQLGRDMLSRLSVATLMSLLIAVGAVLISALLGLVVGLVAGYRRGRIDALLMGLGDIQLAIPVVLLLIVITVTLGSSPLLLVVTLGLMNWMVFGRMVRSVVVSLREREFVRAAVSAGASGLWIMRKHLVRNVIGQVAILGAFQIGVMITIESSLSFIGLGIQPPTPSLGLMVNEGQRVLQSTPSVTILPATAIFFLIAGVQFLSQGSGSSRPHS